MSLGRVEPRAANRARAGSKPYDCKRRQENNTRFEPNACKQERQRAGGYLAVEENVAGQRKRNSARNNSVKEIARSAGATANAKRALTVCFED